MSKTLKSLSLIFCMSLCLTACSTLSSAYESASDTVGGWFKSDDAKK
jgi:hypothetical protein